MVVPWWWHLPNAGVFCCNWAALSPIASSRLSSQCQASISQHDPFKPGPSTAIASADFSQGWASAAVHDPFMPAKPVPPGWLLHIAKSSYQREVQHWLPLNSFCVPTLRKLWQFNSRMYIMILVICPSITLFHTFPLPLNPFFPIIPLLHVFKKQTKNQHGYVGC